MEINYEIIISDEKNKLCNNLHDTFQTCILTCKDNTQKFSFENKILNTFSPSECTNIQNYQQELMRNKISTIILPKKLNALKQYSVKYCVFEKELKMYEE